MEDCLNPRYNSSDSLKSKVNFNESSKFSSNKRSKSTYK